MAWNYWGLRVCINYLWKLPTLNEYGKWKTAHIQKKKEEIWYIEYTPRVKIAFIICTHHSCEKPFSSAAYATKSSEQKTTMLNPSIIVQCAHVLKVHSYRLLFFFFYACAIWCNNASSLKEQYYMNNKLFVWLLRYV